MPDVYQAISRVVIKAVGSSPSFFFLPGRARGDILHGLMSISLPSPSSFSKKEITASFFSAFFFMFWGVLLPHLLRPPPPSFGGIVSPLPRWGVGGDRAIDFTAFSRRKKAGTFFAD